MSLRKSDDFIADAEIQFEWYLTEVGQSVAERHLDSLEAACGLIGRYPQLGPKAGLKHPRLREWRFFVLFRPFNKHVLFYEIADDDVLMRRVMHGYREFPRRLIEPPGPLGH
jgi:plasmid stabilization system protein ParE